MCNQAVNNYALECVPECHKTQEMYDKVANAKLSTTKIVPECSKAQEIFDEAVNKMFFGFDFVPD